MTKNSLREGAPDTDRIPRYAMNGILATVITVSVLGWINTLPGYAGWVAAALAACLEALIFFGLPRLLQHWKDKRKPQAIFLVAVLVIAGGINAVGVDRGLEFLAYPLQRPLDAAHTAAVNDLANDRTQLTDEIAAIERRLQAAAASAPDPLVTNAARMRQWRANYNDATAVDRERLPDARTELERLSAHAEPAERAYPEWLRHLIAGGLFFISMITRFAWGFEAAPHSQRKAPRAKRDEAEAPHVGDASPQSGNVLNFQQARRAKGKAWAEADRAEVRRLKGAGLSSREIEKRTGVPHQTVSRWR